MANEAGECPERTRLMADAIRTIDQMIDVLIQQRSALRRTNGKVACLLDGELGKAVGEKERSTGALCNHEKEHGCG
jgi:hypothetical protein